MSIMTITKSDRHPDDQTEEEKREAQAWGKCDQCDYEGPNVRAVSTFYTDAITRLRGKKICKKCWGAMK